MRTLDVLRCINRKGAPLAGLALLLGMGAFLHRIALGVGTFAYPASVIADPYQEVRLRFVSYLDAHTWVALPFAALFAASLLWLQIRKSPPWALWATFASLALPLVGYMWICLSVGVGPTQVRL